MSQMLSREALLGAVVLPTQDVYIPELGGTVRVRGMSGAERTAWEKSLMRGKGQKRQVDVTLARERMLAYCIIDDNGNPLFSHADLEALSRVRADVLDRLHDVACALSGVGDDDLEDLKNFSGTSPDSSGSRSGSPEN